MKTTLQQTRMALLILVGLFFANHASAADDFVFWPDADYDPAIPSFETVLGQNSRDQSQVPEFHSGT